MNSSPQDATYLVCLAPPGTAALATLALRGPRAWAVARELFQPAGTRPLPSEPEPGRFWTGRLGEESGRDEVVLAVVRGGPAPWVEVHCHGGREVVQLLQEVFVARGVEAVSWEELERRADFQSARCAGRTANPPYEVEALIALARAPTARTAAILLDQYHGAMGRALEAICAALERGDTGEASRLLDELAERIALGRHLTEPWRVVVAGAPNVGKSSLVNALAGYQRSVVSPTPGTTRDVVTVRLALDGWPVEVADTAGWREAAAALESAGIDLARAALAGADLCLWVLDASAPPTWPESLPMPVRCVINKIDLPAAWDLDQAAGAVRVSAHTGEGLAELCQAISLWLVPVPPPTGAGVPFSPAVWELIIEARSLCATGQRQAVLSVLRAAPKERS